MSTDQSHDIAPARLISPDGTICEVVSIEAHCQEYSLDPANIWKVVNGFRQHHKGWRCADIPAGSFDRKPYAIERYLNKEQANVM